MQTDSKPSRRKIRREFEASDAQKKIRVPSAKIIASIVDELATATKMESVADLEIASTRFIEAVADFYRVPRPRLRLLGPRPHKTFEGRLSSELFGDYYIKQQRIRLWTRTPMKKQWTSHGTILSTMCHEFMHHLDIVYLGFTNSFHTMGFYERSHRLYLAVIGHPYYPLKWHVDFSNRGLPSIIDWTKTNRQKRRALARIKNAN